MTELDALKTAIEIIGSQGKLAAALGYSQPSVSDWVNRSGRAPAEAVLDIERLTDGRVSRHQLRPDIYPVESKVLSSFCST